MAIVTIVVNLPAKPGKGAATHQALQMAPQLFDLWMQHHGEFIMGKTFYFLAFSPGTFSPAEAGPTQDATAFESRGGGSVRHAFALSDDPADEQSVYCVQKMTPTPGLWPGEGKMYKRGQGPVTGPGQV